jgi:hypothetical protein
VEKKCRARIAIAICFLGAGFDACAQTADRSQKDMASKVEQHLVGVWRQSREEDTAAESVYRPESFEFPPARGRTGYEFRSDHSCDYIGISPRDGSAKESCTWQLRGGANPEIVLTYPGGRQEVLPVVSVDNERLIVRKSSE